MRLIDADLLAIYKYKFDIFEEVSPQTAFKEGWNNAIDTIIENAPTVDSEPVVHGRWLDVLMVDDDEGETDGVECSVCGYTDINVYWAKTYHRFCPNCGAKMGEIKDG